MAVTFQRLPKASTTDRSELAEKLCNRVIACFPKQIDVFPTDARHVGLKFASLPGDFKTVQTSEQFFRKWLAINTRIFGFVPFCTVFPGAKLRTLKHRDLTLSTFSENAEKRYGALDRSFVNCCSSRFIFSETSIFVRFCPVLLFEFQGLKAGNHGKSSCSARVNEQSTSLPPSQRAPGHTYCKISKNKDVNPYNSSFIQLSTKKCNSKK
jgi:hypothetical protein